MIAKIKFPKNLFPKIPLEVLGKVFIFLNFILGNLRNLGKLKKRKKLLGDKVFRKNGLEIYVFRKNGLGKMVGKFRNVVISVRKESII